MSPQSRLCRQQPSPVVGFTWNRPRGLPQLDSSSLEPAGHREVPMKGDPHFSLVRLVSPALRVEKHFSLVSHFLSNQFLRLDS
ncbi:hypothetical protein EYF80_067184 [Liparis tanakae]|uniref:Uncharacterized protein n=1 Tax=Liparis tanakae TaxID=230148 RepID=A0A4Z2E2G6_9TELE|nr:hypothetical protein EYF80_067184 [Liparis tanakae]